MGDFVGRGLHQTLLSGLVEKDCEQMSVAPLPQRL
jgi:hypothetical protein